MNWLIVALEVIGLAFTISLYQVTIGSYIGSMKSDYTYCVKNNVYGEFWAELIMMFFGAFFTFIFSIVNILKEAKPSQQQ
jgi:hypothetical protein